MRLVFGLVLVVGMGLAGFAVYMVNQYMGAQSSQLERERQRAAQAVVTVDVYAPSRDLTYGDLLTIDDVQIIKYARDFLPEGTFDSEEALFPAGVNTPRVVRTPMFVNEPILDSKVTEAGAPQGITALLDNGMRAFSLPGGMVSAFAGDLRPSDRIDLYWTGRVGNGGQISRLVKSQLEIISTSPTTVIQISQEDFADLQILRAAGSLSLTPVGRDDMASGDTSIETNIQDVLGIIAPQAAPAQQAPQNCFITQRSGAETVQIQIPCASE